MDVHGVLTLNHIFLMMEECFIKINQLELIRNIQAFALFAFPFETPLSPQNRDHNENISGGSSSEMSGSDVNRSGGGISSDDEVRYFEII